MGISRNCVILAVVMLAMVAAGNVGVEAQSPMGGPAAAPEPAVDPCMTAIYNMSDCLPYVEQGSTAAKPDKACCPELAGMLDSNPICLCKLLGKTSDFPIALDLQRALKLPSACGLQTPPLSLCSAVGIPVGAPAEAPGSSEGPGSSAGMGPMAGGPTTPNGATGAAVSVVYLAAGLAMAVASLTL